MFAMEPVEPREIDYRFSLANERTYLAWIRTALALVAGGIAAAKALDFHHEVWRWVIAAPPILAGALLALDATTRWRSYEDAMRAGRPLPSGRGLRLVGVALAVYAIVALLVAAIDG
jgi:putative membrane protein